EQVGRCWPHRLDVASLSWHSTHCGWQSCDNAARIFQYRSEPGSGARTGYGGYRADIPGPPGHQLGGFRMGLRVGMIQFVGGILIYLNPLAGAIALTLVIAVVFLVQGLAQIWLALGLRPKVGWGWLIISGLVAFLAGALLALKIPFTGTVTGISLLVAGGV